MYDDLEEVFFSKRGYVIPKRHVQARAWRVLLAPSNALGAVSAPSCRTRSHRRETALVEATGGSPTYGEITGEGIQQFLQRIPLQPDDVLVDLGSGLGRLTLQVAASCRLRRCEGIELSASRHEQACWVASRLMDLGDDSDSDEAASAAAAATACTSIFASASTSASASTASVASPLASFRSQDPGDSDLDPQQEQLFLRGPGLLLSPVQLRCEDLMTADLRDGTAFFLCSTAFSGGACRAIAERLAHHPPFRLLVTSRALPFPSPLTLLGQFPCSFSWTAAGTAFVYVRSLQEAPAGLLASFLAAAAPGTPQAAADVDTATAESGGSVGPRSYGGLVWLPSTCTLSMVPCDLMV